MNVRDRMGPVFTCMPGQSLHVPAQLMEEHDVSCVVVVDEGKIVGTITDREICLGAMHTSKPLWGTAVRLSMNARPTVVRDDEPLEDALRRMMHEKLRWVPVVDAAGQPVGLLSLDDAGSRNVTSVPWPGSLSISS